jgi:flagellar protein FliO/FliZ
VLRPSALMAVPTATLICALVGPSSALAATDPYHEATPLNLPANGPTSTHASVGGGSGSLVRTFIGLAVVIAVIYGLTWVLRQVKAAKEDRSTGFGLSTEATMTLGSGRSVHLIRAGRELVLVGSAEQGVVPLRTYTEDEALALGLIRAAADDDGDQEAAKPAAKAKTTIGDLLETLRTRTAR